MTQPPPPPLAAAILPWIDALARLVAQDYLRAEAAERDADSAASTKPVPLRDMDKAA